MSKVVTIPKDRNPFVVIVNGVKYSYPAGVTTEVPDEVADVIEKYVGAKPKPDPNAGINFGGTQSDWNQTDSSADDFIKNKPFWEEPAVIFDDSVTFTEEGATFYVSDEIKVGDNVIVEWNGTVYHCVAVPFETYLFIGNGKMLGGDDTGEPFAMVNLQTYVQIMPVDTAVQSASVKIKKNVIYKLPFRYYNTHIPLYINHVDKDDVYIYTDVNLTTKATKEFVINASREAPIIVFPAISGIVADGRYYTQEILGSGEGPAEIVTTNWTYYTAEYVPETTE